MNFMRAVLAFLLVLVGVPVLAQQPLRNQFTTNLAMNAVQDGWSSVWNDIAKRWSNVLIVGGAGDAGGTNARQFGSAILTNFSALSGKSNSVVIIAANNTPTNAQRRFYFETNSSTTLSNLISAAVAGDTVELGSGHFWAELVHLKLPVGVTLRGQGKKSTFLHGKGGLTTNGPIIRLSSSNEVSDLTIICDNKDFFNQAGIGTFGTLGDNGLTNVVLHDIFVDGDSDGFYFSGSLPHFVTGWNLEAQTRWDALAMNTTGNAFSNSVFKFEACIFEANLSGSINPGSIVAATSRGAVIGSGTAIFIGCRLVGTNANDAYGIANVEGGAGRIVLVGCDVHGAGTNNSAPAISPSMPLEFGGVNFGIRELATGSTTDYRPPLSYKATNILAGGLGRLAIESVVDLAEWKVEFLENTGFIQHQGFSIDSWGSGSPEGVVAANVGSNYRCTNCTGSTAWYLKTNGTGNTGWWLVTGGGSGAGDAGGTNARIANPNGIGTNTTLFDAKYASYYNAPVIGSAGTVRLYGTNQLWVLDLTTNALLELTTPLSNVNYQLMVRRQNNSILTFSNSLGTTIPWLSGFAETAGTNWTLFNFRVESTTGDTNAWLSAAEYAIAAGANVTFSTNGNVITIASTGGGTPAGINGDVQWNQGGAFAATNRLTWDTNNNALRITGTAASLTNETRPHIVVSNTVGVRAELNPEGVSMNNSTMSFHINIGPDAGDYGSNVYVFGPNSFYGFVSNNVDSGSFPNPWKTNWMDAADITKTFRYRGGTLGAGKVLTDVAGDGVYTPQTPSGGGGTNFASAIITNQTFYNSRFISGNMVAINLDIQASANYSNDTNTVVDVTFALTNPLPSTMTLFLIGQTNAATNHTVTFTAAGGADITWNTGTNASSAFTLYSNATATVTFRVYTNLVQTNIVAEWKSDSLWPQRNAPLFSSAGAGESNVFHSGQMYFDYAPNPYTNHSATTLNYTNLASMMLPAHTLTNIGDSITAVWRGKFNGAANGTNQLIAGFGTVTNALGDTGSFTNRANASWEFRCEVTAVGPTNHTTFWEFKLSGATTLSGNYTNEERLNFATGIVTNGVTNIVLLQHSGRKAGAISNDFFKVYYQPGSR